MCDDAQVKGHASDHSIDDDLQYILYVLSASHYS